MIKTGFLLITLPKSCDVAEPRQQLQSGEQNSSQLLKASVFFRASGFPSINSSSEMAGERLFGVCAGDGTA